MYEALRAYFVEDRSSAEAAKAFGYTPGSFRVLCHTFAGAGHVPQLTHPELYVRVVCGFVEEHGRSTSE